MFDLKRTDLTRNEFEALAIKHIDPLYSAALRLTKNDLTRDEFERLAMRHLDPLYSAALRLT